MSPSKRLLLVASLLVGASPAAAEPLLYQIQPANFVRVLAEGDIDVSFVPPLGLPPTVVTSTGISQMSSTQSGTATVDVGLPDNFIAGQGLWLETFDARVDVTGSGLLLTDLFEPLLPLLPVPPPIPLVGAVALIDVADLELNLMAPISSNLLSFPDPNQYYWGGVAPLRISGVLNLLVNIPGQESIQLGPVPFDQTLDPAALAGEFTGDDVSTTLTVSLDEATANPDTAPLIAEPLVIDLAPLGAIEVTVRRLRLVLNGRFTAVNNEYGLPRRVGLRGPAQGCGIGPELAALLPLLGWLRRRRQARA
jgi:hypothetical protein